MSKKILVIDDNEGILDAFKAILEFAGYEVLAFSNEEFIYKMKKTEFPDLILLDVLLSGADGRDICKWLKAQKDKRAIPIIMVSAHPSAHKSIQLAGADDFIAKPFDMNDLLSKVSEHLQRNHVL